MFVQIEVGRSKQISGFALSKVFRLVGLFALGLSVAGCAPTSDAEAPAASADNSSQPAVNPPVPEEVTSPTTPQAPQPTSTRRQSPPKPPEIAQVILSAAHQATCLANAGDTFPSASLSDMEGNPREILEQLGQVATVVIFWNANDIHGVAELRELNFDVHQKHAEAGINLIGVHVGDDADSAQAKIDEVGAEFTQLIDPNQELFQQVATEKLPRTYLLDATGNILWFDLEYSRETRRRLLEAIHVVLNPS